MARRRWRPPARRLDGAARAAPGGHLHCLAAARGRRGPSHRRNAGALRTALALRRRTRRDVAVRGGRSCSRPTIGRRSSSPGRLPSSPASRPITPPRSARCSTEGNRPTAVARALAGATASQWRDRGAMLMKAGAADSAYRDYATALDLDPTDTIDARGVRACGHRGASGGRCRAAAARVDSVSRTGAGPARLARRASRDAWPFRRSDSGRHRSHEARARRIPRHGSSWRRCMRTAATSLVSHRRWRCCDATSRAAPQAGTSQPARASCGATSPPRCRSCAAPSSWTRATLTRTTCSARFYATAGDIGAGRDAFRTSLRLDPRDAVTYINLAQLELAAGQRDRRCRPVR